MADSDSENEGILTNIQKLVIRPPGHTGKAKKGHVCFDGGYETMNLGRVDFITNQEYDLFIRPDTANPRPRFWFHFTVENTQKDQRVIFNVVNISKARTLFVDGLTPVVKSTTRPRWQRMQRQYVFYYKSPLHHKNFVLSFAFVFDREDERYHFALTQPYSLSRHNLYMEAILSADLFYFKLEKIGSTIQERPLELLTITDPINLDPVVRKKKQQEYLEHEEDPDHPNTEKKPMINMSTAPPKVVVIMSRVHASDAPSSFIVQGLIDFLVSSHEVAESLRAHIIFKIIPVVNPDGVFLGNTRCNLLGQDLNRNWNRTNKFTHPTISTIKELIHKLDKDSNIDLDIIIDLHANVSLFGVFVVGNAYDDVYRFERHTVFPKILSQICPDFSMENTIYNNDPTKEGTARRYFCDNLSPEVNTYTLEVSVMGYKDPNFEDPIPYTDDMYCRVGRNIGRALWDYYKILGIIPLETEAPPPANLVTMPGGKAPPTVVRSFNLLRLREIQNQRNQSSFTFDLQDEDRNKIDEHEKSLLDKTLSLGLKFYYKKNQNDLAKSQMALPMSVKTILYSSDEDEKLFHFDQPFRKKNKPKSSQDFTLNQEFDWSEVESIAVPSLHQRSNPADQNPELKITQVKGIPIRPYQQDFDEKYFLSSDAKDSFVKTQKAPLKKFVTFEGVSEVELGTGPIIQSHTSMLSSQTYAQHSEGQFIKEGPYVVPEIIVTRMNPIQQEKPARFSRQKRAEREYRRLNFIETNSLGGTSTPPSSSSSNFDWTCSSTKVQKIGGGGCISGGFKTAPRPQSLMPSLPYPPLIYATDVSYISGVHLGGHQRLKMERKPQPETVSTLTTA